MALSITKRRNLFYAYDLTFNEINSKVSYQTSELTAKKMQPQFDALARAGKRGDVRAGQRIVNRIIDIVRKDNARFERNTVKGLSDMSLQANRSRYRLSVDRPVKARRTGAQQLAITEKTSLNKGRDRGRTGRGESPTQVYARQERRLAKNSMRIFRAAQDGDLKAVEQFKQSTTRQFVAQQSTVHRTQAHHATQQAKMEAAREVETDNRYVYLTEDDDRVDSICRPHHNKVYKVGEGPEPPLHYNCRCTIEPADDDEIRERVAQSDDAGKWFESHRDEILKETLEHNPLAHLKRPPTQRSLDRGARLFRSNKESVQAVLRAVKNERRWPSTQSFLTTKGIFNRTAARKALVNRAKMFDVEIRLPGRITAKAPRAKQLSRGAAERTY